MRRAILINTFFALVSSNTLATNPQCEKWIKEARHLTQKADTLKNENGESLLDLKKKRDKALAKMIAIKGLADLKKDYNQALSELHKSDFSRILDGNTYEILKNLDQRFNTVAKYTLASQVITDGYGEKDKKGNDISANTLNSYRKYLNRRGENQETAQTSFFDYALKCEDTFYDRFRNMKLPTGKFVKDLTCGPSGSCKKLFDNLVSTDDFAGDIDELDITQIDNSDDQTVSMMIYESAKRCRNIKKISADIKSQTDQTQDFRTFFNNYAVVMSKVSGSDERSASEFMADKGKELSEFNQNFVSRIFSSNGEKIGKMDSSTNGLEFSMNNYDKFKQQYRGITDNLFKGKFKDTISQDDMEKVSGFLSSLNSYKNKCASNPAQCSSPLTKDKKKQITDILQKAAKGMGLGVRVFDEKLLAEAQIESNALKNAKDKIRKLVSKYGKGFVANDDADSILEDTIKGTPYLFGACDNVSFANHSSDKDEEMIKCLNAIDTHRITGGINTYGGEFRILEKEIKDLQLANKDTLKAIEKGKLFVLDNVKSHCGNSISIQQEQLNLFSCDKEYEDKIDGTSHLSNLILTMNDTQETIIMTDHLKKIGGPASVDFTRTSNLKSLFSELCVEYEQRDTEKECSEEMSCSTCSELENQIEIARQNRIREEAEKFKQADVIRRKQFSDNKYYLEYDPSRDKMVPKRRPTTQLMTHTLKYFSKNLHGILGPKIAMQNFRGSLYGLEASAIYMKQTSHWNKQYQERMYSMNNPNLYANFYTGLPYGTWPTTSFQYGTQAGFPVN